MGHPILENEDFENLESALNEQINFKSSKINKFSLKYLAKFIYNQRVANLAINGGYMPLDTIKMDRI